MPDADSFELQPLRDWIEAKRPEIRHLGEAVSSWPSLDTVICPTVDLDDPAAAAYIAFGGDLALVFFDLVEVVRQGDVQQTEQLMGELALSMLPLHDAPAFGIEVRPRRDAPEVPELSRLATELCQGARAALVACVAVFEAAGQPATAEG